MTDSALAEGAETAGFSIRDGDLDLLRGATRSLDDLDRVRRLIGPAVEPAFLFRADNDGTP